MFIPPIIWQQQLLTHPHTRRLEWSGAPGFLAHCRVRPREPHVFAILVPNLRFRGWASWLFTIPISVEHHHMGHGQNMVYGPWVLQRVSLKWASKSLINGWPSLDMNQSPAAPAPVRKRLLQATESNRAGLFQLFHFDVNKATFNWEPHIFWWF